MFVGFNLCAWAFRQLGHDVIVVAMVVEFVVGSVETFEAAPMPVGANAGASLVVLCLA